MPEFTKKIAPVTVGFPICITGCFDDPLPVGDDGETGGEKPSECWCATVEDAEVDPTAGQPEPVEDPDNGNGSPKSCLGANQSLHDDLAAIATNNEAVATSSHDQDLIDFRDAVFAAAESHCDDLDITSALEMAYAYVILWGEAEFELVVNRPGVRRVTLNYEIVE